MADKKTFVMYKSWKDLFLNLPKEMAGELIQAVFLYQDGEDASIDNPALSAIFGMISNKMDEDGERYQRKVEANIANGKKGGRPKNRNNPVGFSESENNPVGFSESETKRKNPQKPDTDTVYVTDTVTDIDIVINKDNKKEKENRKKEGSREKEHKAVFRTFTDCGFMLNQHSADRLKQLLEDYSDEWVVEAIKRSADRGKKSLSYIEGILSSWRQKGAIDDGRRTRSGPSTCSASDLDERIGGVVV